MKDKLMQVWNKTGTVVGGLSRSDLIRIIRDSNDAEMRERCARWLVLIVEEDEGALTVSLPYLGGGKPTIEE